MGLDVDKGGVAEEGGEEVGCVVSRAQVQRRLTEFIRLIEAHTALRKG